MIDYLDLFPIPYEEGARGPAKYDCYGLVREMYRRDWGVVIADYPTHSTPNENVAEMLKAAETDWTVVTRPQPRCAVTFLLPKGHVHIGYMVNGHEFIHTLAKIGVSVESIQSLNWRNKVTGFQQWKSLS